MTSASWRTFLATVAVSTTAVLSAARAADAPEAAKPALRVSVSVPANHGSRGIILNRPDSHFHIVVTNVSDAPQRLWREWCSWGFFNLTFKIVDANGEESVATKKQREWTKNYPDFMELAPGEHYVIDVYPHRDWTGFPLPANGKEMKLKLRAVYEIRPDDDSKKLNVWTGRIESDAIDVTVYNWGVNIPPKKAE